jgi:signal transduction histidine kinase
MTAFLCFFVIVISVSGLALFSADNDSIRQLSNQWLKSESRLIAPGGNGVSRSELKERITTLSKHGDLRDFGVEITDIMGGPIAGNVKTSKQPPIGFSVVDVQNAVGEHIRARGLTRALGQGIRLTVVAKNDPFDRYKLSLTQTYLFDFGAIMTIVLLGALLYQRFISRRIDELCQTAAAIADGDLQHRMPVTRGAGAFQQQAEEFNRMLDCLGERMAQIRNVSNDISHELRAPLARLSSQLASLAQTDDAKLVHEDLLSAITQANILLATFGALLRIAEIEGGDRRAGFITLSLGGLVSEITHMMKPVALETGHHLVLGLCDAADISGDRLLLTQMLINLVENGLRHTPPKTSIKLAVAGHENCAILTVQDDGYGIDPEQRRLVLSRFGRLTRSTPTVGHGLGLPLVDAIVRLHHGELRLEDAKPGLRVRIALPLTASRERPLSKVLRHIS